jgi:hypothetical protein
MRKKREVRVKMREGTLPDRQLKTRVNLHPKVRVETREKVREKVREEMREKMRDGHRKKCGLIFPDA